MERLENILKNNSFSPIIPNDLQHGPSIILDMNDPIWQQVDLKSPDQLWAQTQKLMNDSSAVVAIGKYAEDRANIYKRSELFTASMDPRTIHLGIDLMVEEGTPVFAPLDSKINSFSDNDQFGDYGPTIVLEHELEGVTFFTLYGHLSKTSLKSIEQGQLISKGEQFATVGNMQENGFWPPHVHFQIIADMQDYSGNFPGVTSEKDARLFFEMCPDPNLILGIRGC